MAKTTEEKKQAQAIAHRKWRESEKGKAYFHKRKLAKYTIAESQVNERKD
jgi:hypothetical protein